MESQDIFAVGTAIGLASILAYLWIRGIDRAIKDYPDYKGEDLFDEEPPKKKTE